MKSTLGADHFKRINELASQYGGDANIRAVMGAMNGPDISGKVFPSALVMSMCISTIQG